MKRPILFKHPKVRRRETELVSLLKKIYTPRKQPVPVGLPILVRLWEEDGVWNVSAFDVPVAVFGNTFDEARSNFEEALSAHFELLVEMNRAKKVCEDLSKAALDRGFYDRIKPRETVEKFLLESPKFDLCLS